MKTYYISNQNQTDVFVSEFAKSMKPENIILLNGDLGTGKARMFVPKLQTTSALMT